MVFILEVAVGFLACAFFLFVLFQWARDTKRKIAARTAMDEEASETSGKKRLETGASASTEKRDRFSGRPRQMHREKGSRGCRLGCDECERARAVAGLDATNASGLLMKKLPDRCGQANRS